MAKKMLNLKKYYRDGYLIFEIRGIRIKVSKQIETIKRHKKTDTTYAPCNLEEDTVFINLVGDLMCETFCQQKCIYDGVYSYKNCFRYVKSVLEDADFTIGNLESTISENHPYMGQTSRLNGGYNCNSPVEFLDAVRHAGFNVLTAANNHNLDAQKRGHLDTIRHIEEYGFQYTGIFKDENQERFLILEKKGIKIGVLSYYTEHNKIQNDFSADDIKLFFNKYSKAKAAQDVRILREKGADFIIAYIHWGIERVHTTTPYQRRTARELAEAGVDFIAGSHPHALQPYDEIAVKGKKVPVCFSLGNFLSSSKLGQCTRDTVIWQLKLQKRNGVCSLIGNDYIPCQIFDTFDNFDYPVIPLVEKFNSGISSPMFKKSIRRIDKILGKKNM